MAYKKSRKIFVFITVIAGLLLSVIEFSVIPMLLSGLMIYLTGEA